jgi:hypothetical protein
MAEQKYSHAKAGVSASGFKNSIGGRMKKRVIDLCSGRGGWAAGFIAQGWDVIAVDIKHFRDNPARRFIVGDILDNRIAQRFPRADLYVASPPCTQFSKHDQPGLYPNLPAPSMQLVQRCFELAEIAGCQLVLENVRGLQKFLGTAAAHYGSFYLWGDGVPCIMPHIPGRQGRPKLKWNHRSPSMRAKIPFELAYWIAQTHNNRMRSAVPARRCAIPAERGMLRV